MNRDPEQLFHLTQCGKMLPKDCTPGPRFTKHRSQQFLACWNRTILLCHFTHKDSATNTTPNSRISAFLFALMFAFFGDFCDARFIFLHSATAAHNLLLLMQLIRRLVESPVLGTACLEQPAAHSLKIHLPERRMDICIIRLDRACEAWRGHQFHPNQCHPNEPRPPPRLRRSASCPPPRARLKKFPNETEWSGPGLAKNELTI